MIAALADSKFWFCLVFTLGSVSVAHFALGLLIDVRFHSLADVLVLVASGFWCGWAARGG